MKRLYLLLSLGLSLALILCISKIFLVNSEQEREKNAGEDRVYIFTPADTNQARIEILKQFGWEVSPTPIEASEIKIPSSFDNIYENYNRLQLSLGMDLNKYKGVSAARFTYEVYNYEGNGDDEKIVRANLIVHEDEVIAGDIMVSALDGFMHSLKKPEDE